MIRSPSKLQTIDGRDPRDPDAEQRWMTSQEVIQFLKIIRRDGSVRQWIRKHPDSIVICSWNANSLNAAKRADPFYQQLKHASDILCINHAGKGDGSIPFIAGANSWNAVYDRGNNVITSKRSGNNFLLKLGGLDIASTYLRPGDHANQTNWLNRLLRYRSTPTIILGDLNVKPNQPKFSELLQDGRDLMHSAYQNPPDTRIPYSDSHRPSRIDHAILKFPPNMPQQLREWDIVQSRVSADSISDHRAILLELRRRNGFMRPRRGRVIIHRRRFPCYCKEALQSLENVSSEFEWTAWVENFMNNTPRRKGNSNLPATIRKLVKIKHKLMVMHYRIKMGSDSSILRDSLTRRFGLSTDFVVEDELKNYTRMIREEWRRLDAEEPNSIWKVTRMLHNSRRSKLYMERDARDNQIQKWSNIWKDPGTRWVNSPNDIEDKSTPFDYQSHGLFLRWLPKPRPQISLLIREEDFHFYWRKKSWKRHAIDSAPSPLDHIRNSDIARLDKQDGSKLLHKIWHFCSEYGPKGFLDGGTVLIPKGVTGDARPITLLSNVYKAVSRVVAYKLMKFQNGELFHKNQIGFREGMETGDGISRVKSFFEMHAQGIAEFVDLRKAFDSVHVCWLKFCAKLAGLYYSLGTWIEGFRNQKRYLIMNGVMEDEPILCGRGVPQGDSLSPVLFNLAMFPLCKILNDPRMKQGSRRHCGSIFYADDIVVLDKTYDGIQVANWMIEGFSRFSGLKVNADKTKYMTKRKFRDRKTVTLEESRIDYVQEYTYLGATFELLKNAGTDWDLQIAVGPKHCNRVFDAMEKDLAFYQKHKGMMSTFARSMAIRASILGKMYGTGYLDRSMRAHVFGKGRVKKLEVSIRKFLRSPKHFKLPRNYVLHYIWGVLPLRFECMKRCLRIGRLLQRLDIQEEARRAWRISSGLFDEHNPVGDFTNQDIVDRAWELYRLAYEGTNGPLATKYDGINIQRKVKFPVRWRPLLQFSWPGAMNHNTVMKGAGGASCPKCGHEDPDMNHYSLHCVHSSFRAYLIEGNTELREDNLEDWSLFQLLDPENGLSVKLRKRIVGGFTICVENWKTYIDAHKVYGELMFGETASEEDVVDEFFDNGLF